MRIRFTVGDLNEGSIVEAAVDAVKIGYNYCNEVACEGDVDGNNAVGVGDILAVIAQWGTSGSADVNDDGEVNVTDLLIVVANWGPCP